MDISTFCLIPDRKLLKQNECMNADFWGIYMSNGWRQSESQHMASVVILRTVQSGGIVAGVGLSPSWSLGKEGEQAEPFTMISLHSTDLEKNVEWNIILAAE